MADHPEDEELELTYEIEDEGDALKTGDGEGHNEDEERKRTAGGGTAGSGGIDGGGSGGGGSGGGGDGDGGRGGQGEGDGAISQNVQPGGNAQQPEGGGSSAQAQRPAQDVAGHVGIGGAIPGAQQQHSGGGGGGGGFEGLAVFVGDLHWWTTDADIEAGASEYGKVVGVKFFEEKATGRSKGYCQVDFADAAAARACKENMAGRLFNGRACVVTPATPQTLRHLAMASAQAGPHMGPGGMGGEEEGEGELVQGGCPSPEGRLWGATASGEYFEGEGGGSNHRGGGGKTVEEGNE
ncbi:hypothetical protein CLOM_g13930 [Closterium sp. NIES-68]|nr:hypothetical protein CLOM_g13930 [Closterium sp. NIES-68]GJP76803.1 hypothetical protein CLOP_g7263 [Closterium sp. NIES-67]